MPAATIRSVARGAAASRAVIARARRHRGGRRAGDLRRRAGADGERRRGRSELAVRRCPWPRRLVAARSADPAARRRPCATMCSPLPAATQRPFFSASITGTPIFLMPRSISAKPQEQAVAPASPPALAYDNDMLDALAWQGALKARQSRQFRGISRAISQRSVRQACRGEFFTLRDCHPQHFHGRQRSRSRNGAHRPPRPGRQSRGARLADGRTEWHRRGPPSARAHARFAPRSRSRHRSSLRRRNRMPPTSQFRSPTRPAAFRKTTTLYAARSAAARLAYEAKVAAAAGSANRLSQETDRTFARRQQPGAGGLAGAGPRGAKRASSVRSAIRRQRSIRRPWPYAKRKTTGSTRCWSGARVWAVCDPPVESNTGMVNVCRGPLQTSSGALDTPAGDQAINWACGIKEGARPLGAIAGKRIFGCGYGIHPEDPDGKYPGNQDIAAKLGMADVPGRATFHCSRRTSAFCRSS